MNKEVEERAGKGEMQIQVELKREMKRWRSWEEDRDRNIKILVCNACNLLQQQRFLPCCANEDNLNLRDFSAE